MWSLANNPRLHNLRRWRHHVEMSPMMTSDTNLFRESIHCQLVNSQFVCAVASSLNVKKDVKEWRKEDSARGNQDLWSQISSLDEMFECTLGTHPSLSQPSSSPVHYWCPNCASLLLLNTSLIDIIRCKNVQKSASIASSHHPLQTAKCFIWTDEVKMISA